MAGDADAVVGSAQDGPIRAVRTHQGNIRDSQRICLVYLSFIYHSDPLAYRLAGNALLNICAPVQCH